MYTEGGGSNEKNQSHHPIPIRICCQLPVIIDRVIDIRSLD